MGLSYAAFTHFRHLPPTSAVTFPYAVRGVLPAQCREIWGNLWPLFRQLGIQATLPGVSEAPTGGAMPMAPPDACGPAPMTTPKASGPAPMPPPKASGPAPTTPVVVYSSENSDDWGPWAADRSDIHGGSDHTTDME